MKKLPLLLTISVLLAPIANQCFAKEIINDTCERKKGEQKCECYADKADYYEDQMRSGYTASEYNALEENRKYFREKAFNCKPDDE